MVKKVTKLMLYILSALTDNKRHLILAILLLLLFDAHACKPFASEQHRGLFNVGFSVYEFTCINDDGDEEILTTYVWYPTMEKPSQYTYDNNVTSVIAFNALPERSRGPYPLIIFNHGAFACGTRNLPFTEHLAGEGFIVASTDFIDTKPMQFMVKMTRNRRGDEEFISTQAILDAIKEFSKIISGNRELFLSYLERYRFRIACFVIDSMMGLNQDSTSPFYNLIDEHAIGMAGSSLGGTTTLGLICQYPDNGTSDKRVKAAVLLSPTLYPFEEDSVGQIDIPIMVMHGNLDLSSMRHDVIRKVTYDHAHPPKFYLVIKQCRHFGFNNSACKHYDLIPQCLCSNDKVKVITDYSTAFFKRYLLQDSHAGEKLLEKDRMLVKYEYELH